MGDPGIRTALKKVPFVLGLVRRKRIRAAVTYSMSLARRYLSFIDQYQLPIAGRTILEIGPGRNFGPALILMGHGARLVLVDKYLNSFENDFHPGYYKALRKTAKKAFPRMDTTPFDSVIGTNSYQIEHLHLYPEALEDVDIADDSIDLSFSNAVLEHLYDCDKAIARLARLTVINGIGIHQIDLRDHHDFSRPLEHLTVPSGHFWEEFVATDGRFGNGMRYPQFIELFQRHGFTVERIDKNQVCDDDYLDEVIPRMIDSYRTLDREAHRVLGVQLFIRKLRRP